MSFQTEIGRLFGTAGLIIALVLALVFLIRPKRRSVLVMMRVGILAVVTLSWWWYSQPSPSSWTACSRTR